MNLQQLKQEAREYAKAQRQSFNRDVQDEDILQFIDKVVDAVEASVVPMEAVPSDWDDDDKPKLRARMFNDCRDAVLEAFRNFKGV